MYDARHPARGPRPGARRGRHRRRPVDVGEHLHDGRDRRRRRGRAGGQARQPVRLLQGRLAPTCSRRSASGSTCPPTDVARVGERGRHHLLLRRRLPPGAAARRRAPPRARASPPPSTSSARWRNPAKPAAQAIGCADARMAPLMAGVFARRGVDAWVFRGDDGLDELTTTTTSQVWAVARRRRRAVRRRPGRVRPRRRHARRACAGGTPPTTPTSCGGWSAGETGPGARRRAAQRRRRPGRARRRGRRARGRGSPPASSGPSRPWTPAARTPSSTGGWRSAPRCDRRGWRPVPRWTPSLGR